MRPYYLMHRNPKVGGGWRLFTHRHHVPYIVQANSFEEACAMAVVDGDVLWELRHHGNKRNDGTPVFPFSTCGGCVDICAVPADLGDTAGECQERLAETLREHRVPYRQCEAVLSS